MAVERGTRAEQVIVVQCMECNLILRFFTARHMATEKPLIL